MGTRKTTDAAAELLLEYEQLGGILSADQQRETGARSPDAHHATDEGYDGRQHLWLTPDQAEKARSRKSYPQPKAECYLDRIPKAWRDKWAGREIKKSDWAPSRPDKHSNEFRRFIMSGIPRFDRLEAYEEFYLYVEQSERWKAERVNIENYKGQEKWDMAMRELERVLENKLYGMDKYIWIRDDALPGGQRKYLASAPQALLLFVRDRMHSIELGKGRQAAITSTIEPAAMLTALTKASFKGYLITDDVEQTGQAIFNEKYSSTFKTLVEKHPWFAPESTPHTATKNLMFDWSDGDGKSGKKQLFAQYQIVSADDPQTINGTTPSEIDFDEVQNIPTYGIIKREARPTMRAMNADGELMIVRQILAWGTGTSNHKGKGSFESEYRGTLKRFETGEDTSSFVPLFFDWTCRPGMTREIYLEEMSFYLSEDNDAAKGLTMEEKLAAFCAGMPSTPEDMFLTSHKTVVPITIIKSQQERIIEKVSRTQFAPQRGRFEPIFDRSIVMPPGSYLPHPVSGARWVPARPDDVTAPMSMMFPPERGWIYRYYQGTDPIQSDGGGSKFASAIWDQVGRRGKGCCGVDAWHLHPTVSCVMNARVNRVDDLFLQSKLMGMFYANHGQRACKELVEYNQGQSYIREICGPQYDLSDSFIYRAELPMAYRGGQQTYGVDLKGGKNSRKEALYRDTVNMVYDHGKFIYYYDYWAQLRNIEVKNKMDGSVEWGSQNEKIFNDDIVFAVSYANLAARAIGQDPRQINEDEPEWVEEEELVRLPDMSVAYRKVKRQVLYT